MGARSRRLWRTAWSMRLFDPNFRSQAPQYIFQCLLATLSLVAILLAQDAVLRAAIVVAVASTAFIVFVVPHLPTAVTRKVVGGHVVAVVLGTAATGALRGLGADTFETDRQAFYVAAAVAAGLSIFVMVVTDTEHAPAAGTALGMVIPDWSWSAAVFVLVAAVVLATVRVVLCRRMVNLL